MKIIISPSKTQKRPSISGEEGRQPVFREQAMQLASMIKKMKPDEIQDAFHIKGDLLAQTLHAYDTFGEGPQGLALGIYTGQVFRQFAQTEAEKKYFKSNLLILSALYGVLRPDDAIENYRLDMKVKVLKEGTLYSFWKPYMTDYFKDEKQMINLASEEFSKMVPYPMVDVVFKERVGSTYRVKGTYSKMARGQLLRFMAENQVDDLEGIKGFNRDGYRYDAKESDPQKMIFLRG